MALQKRHILTDPYLKLLYSLLFIVWIERHAHDTEALQRPKE